MLFRKSFWPGIAAGDVTLAFRRWKRPTVRAGGELRSPAGLLAIDSVAVIGEAEIVETDAAPAGFDSRAQLLAELAKHGDGDLYRIAFHLAEVDRRKTLREDTLLDEAAMSVIRVRMERLDRASPTGLWTKQVLEIIEARPGVVSTALAAELGRERFSFKADVRKLKAMGLTESLLVGYRLSPRGRAVLAVLG
jgi:hypothetical protein